MKREEQIEQKAKELGQKYFPNEYNIWARPNYEAQYVEFACKEMMEWADAHPSQDQIDALRMEYEKGIADAIENIVEWLKCNFNMPDDFESHLKNYMEEQQ